MTLISDFKDTVLYLEVDLSPKDPSSEWFASQLFLASSLKTPRWLGEGETPLLARLDPSLRDIGGLALALLGEGELALALLDGGPSWITIEPRPLLYWTSACWCKSLQVFFSSLQISFGVAGLPFVLQFRVVVLSHHVRRVHFYLWLEDSQFSDQKES